MSKRKGRRRHSRNKKARRSDRSMRKRSRAKRSARVVKRSRRRRNPARKARVTTTTTRTRIVRRSNPSRPVYALVARRKGGGKLLRFTGTKFSDQGKAKLFPSLEELRTWAKRLRAQYGAVLKHYDLYSDTRYVK